MGKSDEAGIKAEIDSIAKNINAILKRIEAAMPSEPDQEKAGHSNTSPDAGMENGGQKPDN